MLCYREIVVGLQFKVTIRLILFKDHLRQIRPTHFHYFLDYDRAYVEWAGKMRRAGKVSSYEQYTKCKTARLFDQLKVLRPSTKNSIAVFFITFRPILCLNFTLLHGSRVARILILVEKCRSIMTDSRHMTYINATQVHKPVSPCLCRDMVCPTYLD